MFRIECGAAGCEDVAELCACMEKNASELDLPGGSGLLRDAVRNCCC